MKLRLHEKTIVLPNELNSEERVKFAQDLTEQYPDNFISTGNKEIDKMTTIRLDILSTYILQGVEGIRKDKMIMSRYKEKRRPYQERVISNMFGNEERKLNDAVYGCQTYSNN